MNGTGRRDLLGEAQGAGCPIREAGDSALVLELGAVIDPVVNAHAIAIAREMVGRRLPGVRDVVPTFRSVAVHFDPLAIDAVQVADAMRDAFRTRSSEFNGSLVEIPVSYGGFDGPDLAEVAAWAGLSEQDVIGRHAADEYRVFMMGFLPGFGYLGTVDRAIAAPRKASPRLQVPGGSVGIAGRQTGIYPRSSPGGWQLIGRTSIEMFEIGRERPSLLAPGDRVRFIPTDRRRADPAADSRVRAGETTLRPSSGRIVTVVRAGLFTTIQDSGRWGHQHEGVPVAGPMDPVSHRLANALVGNAADAATLEATMLGPELRFEQPTVVAVTGGDLGPSLDGVALPLNAPRVCGAGSVLRFGERRAGSRAYVACDGGVAVPRALGSRATHVLIGLGGIDGRVLAAGDRLPLGQATVSPVGRVASVPALPKGGARLRVMRGPYVGDAGEAAFETLSRARFTVSPQSDRMGYRLAGGGVARPAGNSISDATFVGAVQVTPSGEPILLMADRQTTGGYPQIATVISADLPLAGQLAPGDWIEFDVCTRPEAMAALMAQEQWLRAVG